MDWIKPLAKHEPICHDEQQLRWTDNLNCRISKYLRKPIGSSWISWRHPARFGRLPLGHEPFRAIGLGLAESLHLEWPLWSKPTKHASLKPRLWSHQCPRSFWAGRSTIASSSSHAKLCCHGHVESLCCSYADEQDDASSDVPLRQQCFAIS